MKNISAFLLLFLAFAQVSCSAKQAKTAGTRVEIETEFGKMVFHLYDETPLHRDNFVKLANEGFYNELLFHRVIGGFMVQGGDPGSKGAAPGQRLGSGGPGYTIPAEIDHRFCHKKGALAAARQGDHVNPEKRSSGSQFFIVQGEVFTEGKLDSMEIQLNNRRMQTISQKLFSENQARLNRLMQENKRDSVDLLLAELKEAALQQMQQTEAIKISPERRQAYSTIGGYPSLDDQYTVFGELIEGFDVLDKLAAVKTDRYDRPESDLKMTVKVLK